MNIETDECKWVKNFNQEELDQIDNTTSLHDLSGAEWEHIEESKDIVLLKLMSIALLDEISLNL